ncbi:unnamed protein product [Brassica oleracea]|uniref:(rape) hypothetical protein n=1 Tax=Brassica napus TaxID=3708 RepID=A0A816IRG7_BRANA|nr:unnamed protein product [Brassica napus]
MMLKYNGGKQELRSETKLKSAFQLLRSIRCHNNVSYPYKVELRTQLFARFEIVTCGKKMINEHGLLSLG